MRCKIHNLIVVLVSTAFLFSALPAQDLQKIVNNVDMPYVNKLQVQKDPDGYVLQVTVTLQNKNEFQLKLRDARFDVRFEGDRSVVPAGKTTVDQQELPKGAESGPGSAQMVLNVFAGPDNADTLSRLIKIINIIGDPNVKPRMYVEGTSELGLELDRGWVFEKGKRFDVQLRFEPQFQRDVFLK